MDQASLQLVAVVLGGLLAIAGSVLTTTLLEQQKQRQESGNLALEFKGEITAPLEIIKERRYLDRVAGIIEQMEATGEPFFMPFRVRFEYDRVYGANVDHLGVL